MSLRDRLPSVFPIFDSSSDIRGFVDAFDSELESFENDVDSVRKSIRLREATGRSLDFIGDDYGPLGRRRGRDDDEYRQYLQSIVAAFDGRGTNEDVRIAVAAGLATDPDTDVELLEDFANNEYEVELYEWPAHSSGTPRELAEFADPVAVDRVDPVHYILSEASVAYEVGDTESGIESRSETAEATYTADDTVSTTVNSDDTFGTGRFDGENTFS